MRVLRSFKGGELEEFLIYTHNSAINWQEDEEAYMNKDSIYLIVPYFDKNEKFHLSGCSYIISNKAKSFRRDSICFSALSSRNAYVNNVYFKGAIVDGKPDGMWREDSDSGVYNNGKRVGKWIEYGQNSRYKNGRRVYFEESWVGDTIIVHNGKLNTINCKGQKLSVWSLKKFGDKIDKYKKGILYQSFIYDKLGDVKEIRCYKNGVLIHRTKYNPKKENEKFVSELNFDPEGYFLYNDYRCESVGHNYP